MPQLQKAIFVFSVVAITTAVIVIYNKVSPKEDPIDPWRGMQQF